MDLSKPYNWLHTRGGHRVAPGPRFAVLAWMRGDVTFQPKGQPAPTTREITRVWIQRLDKPNRVPYYDISSHHVQAQLAGYLDTQTFVGLEFSIRAHGYKPHKAFGLHVRPIGGPAWARSSGAA
jgi:hypothetical protein